MIPSILFAPKTYFESANEITPNSSSVRRMSPTLTSLMLAAPRSTVFSPTPRPPVEVPITFNPSSCATSGETMATPPLSKMKRRGPLRLSQTSMTMRLSSPSCRRKRPPHRHKKG